jgi:glutamyl-tRNA(Gln) amidotransferase subunit D
VRKLHTSRRDAFRSVNAKPFAKIWYENRRMELLRDDYKKRGHAGRFALDDKIDPRVGFVTVTGVSATPDLRSTMP